MASVPAQPALLVNVRGRLYESRVMHICPWQRVTLIVRGKGDAAQLLIRSSHQKELSLQVESELLQRLEGMAHAQRRTGVQARHRSQVELYFRRNTDCWEAVLDFLHTGELHMPQNVCPQAFKRELEFWGVESSNLSKCCHHRVQGFLQNMQTLNSFDREQATSHLDRGHALPPNPSWWQRARHHTWLVLDQPTTSRTAKAYFCMSMLLVVLSVLAMTLSSMESLRLPLSNDQWREVLGKNVRVLNATHIELDNEDASRESSDAAEEEEATPADTSSDPGNASFATAGRRRRAAPPSGNGSSPSLPPPSLASSNPGVTTSDRLNPTATTEHFHEGVHHEPKGTPPKPKADTTTTTSKPRQLSATPVWLSILEITTVVFFACELVARLTFCPNRRRYLLHWYNVADILALLSSVILTVFHWVLPQFKYSRSLFDIIEVLKVLRLLRFFRPLSYVRGFKVLTFTLVTSAVDLALLLGLLFLSVIAFASLLFYVDTENDSMHGIPDAAWWAIVTMTTVGYGDVTPKYWVAKIVGACCAVSGVLLLASIMPIFVNTFLLIYSYSKVATVDTPLEKDAKGSEDDVKALKTTSSKGDKPNSWNLKHGADMAYPDFVAMVTRSYQVPAYARSDAMPSSPPPPFSYKPSDLEVLEPSKASLPNLIS